MSGRDRGRKNDSEFEPSVKRRTEGLSDNSKQLADRSQSEDIIAASLHDQVEMLNDPRISHTANTEQAARLLKGLQQSRGNAHVQRLLNTRTVQAKLTVHPPDDVYEKEADRVGDAVTQSQQQVQRQAEEEEEIQMEATDIHLPVEVQRQEHEQGEEDVTTVQLQPVRPPEKKALKSTKDPKQIVSTVLEALMETEKGKQITEKLSQAATTDKGMLVLGMLAVPALAAAFATEMEVPKGAVDLVPKILKLEPGKDMEVSFQPIYRGKFGRAPKEWGGTVDFTWKF